MNKREARRWATEKVAAAAYELAGRMDELDHAPGDANRLRDAFEAIGYELACRADPSCRKPRRAQENPDQYTIFCMEEE